MTTSTIFKDLNIPSFSYYNFPLTANTMTPRTNFFNHNPNSSTVMFRLNRFPSLSKVTLHFGQRYVTVDSIFSSCQELATDSNSNGQEHSGQDMDSLLSISIVNQRSARGLQAVSVESILLTTNRPIVLFWSYPGLWTPIGWSGCSHVIKKAISAIDALSTILTLLAVLALLAGMWFGYQANGFIGQQNSTNPYVMTFTFSNTTQTLTVLNIITAPMNTTTSSSTTECAASTCVVISSLVSSTQVMPEIPPAVIAAHLQQQAQSAWQTRDSLDNAGTVLTLVALATKLLDLARKHGLF